jgi:hypothetical protein
MSIAMWAGRTLFDSGKSGSRRFCAFIVLLLVAFFSIILIPALSLEGDVEVSEIEGSDQPEPSGEQPGTE